MLRTQIYLPKELYFKLKEAKRIGGSPLGEIIRKIVMGNIDRYISKIKEEKKSNGYTLKEIVALNFKCKTAPRNLSAKMDDYLYGE